MSNAPALNFNPKPGIDYSQLVKPGTTNYTGPTSTPTDWSGVATAGIGAAGSLIGGYLSSRAANNATKASAASTAAALQFERERQRQAQANYEQAMQDYRRQWDAWNAGRTALLQRYGIDVAQPQTLGQMIGGR